MNSTQSLKKTSKSKDTSVSSRTRKMRAMLNILFAKFAEGLDEQLERWEVKTE